MEIATSRIIFNGFFIFFNIVYSMEKTKVLEAGTGPGHVTHPGEKWNVTFADSGPCGSLLVGPAD